MLTVYLGKRPEDLDIVDFNDAWFDTQCSRIDFNKDTVKKIIKSVDDVGYISDYMIEAKFKPGMAVSVTTLSTGCKTALNICRFRDKVFNIAECGDNALNVVFGLEDGNCYMPFFMLPDSLSNTVELVVRGKKIVASEYDRLVDIIDGLKESELSGG